MYTLWYWSICEPWDQMIQNYPSYLSSPQVKWVYTPWYWSICEPWDQMLQNYPSYMRKVSKNRDGAFTHSPLVKRWPSREEGKKWRRELRAYENLD